MSYQLTTDVSSERNQLPATVCLQHKPQQCDNLHLTSPHKQSNLSQSSSPSTTNGLVMVSKVYKVNRDKGVIQGHNTGKPLRMLSIVILIYIYIYYSSYLTMTYSPKVDMILKIQNDIHIYIFNVCVCVMHPV